MTPLDGGTASGVPADRLLVVPNPNAGNVDDEAIGALCRTLSAEADLRVAVADGPDQVAKLLDDRLDEERLVLVGGDGSLNVGINALSSLDRLDETEIAYVPLGTANALGTAVGIPRDPVGAARRCLHGARHEVDLAVADDGRVVVNGVHTGAGAVALRAVDRAKPALGPLAYPIVNAAVGARTRGWAVQVEVDGRPLVPVGSKVLWAAVGNTPVLGDDIWVWDGAQLDDGLLDVVVFLAGSRVRRAADHLSLLRRRHRERPRVLSAKGAEVRVVGGPGAHNADGEMWHDLHDVTYRAISRCWTLVA